MNVPTEGTVTAEGRWAVELERVSGPAGRAGCCPLTYVFLTGIAAR